MTWTSAFGRACGVLLKTIVRWLALTKINPNVLTFMGLVVNAWAAFLFGYATAETQQPAAVAPADALGQPGEGEPADEAGDREQDHHLGGFLRRHLQEQHEQRRRP